jgi:hypothetical protein
MIFELDISLGQECGLFWLWVIHWRGFFSPRPAIH